LPMTGEGVGDNYKTVRSYLWKSRATMGKVMISITDESEELVREEVGKLYYGRTGGFSIFFEGLIRQYFNGHTKEKKSK
jgi:hypothetical protein